MSGSVLRDKSLLFAIRIVKLAQHIQKEKEFILSNQILKSRTAIGALIMEAAVSQSKPDFIHKMGIALKEANETHYWLSLLIKTDLMEYLNYKSMETDCNELIKKGYCEYRATKYFSHINLSQKFNID